MPSKTVILISKIDKLILNPLIIAMFAVAIAYFLFGVVTFLSNSENEEKRSAGKQHMLWGIIGIFIMVAVFGIMHLILNTLGVTQINPESGTVVPFTH